jgi:hypothetical protein
MQNLFPHLWGRASRSIFFKECQGGFWGEIWMGRKGKAWLVKGMEEVRSWNHSKNQFSWTLKYLYNSLITNKHYSHKYVIP